MTSPETDTAVNSINALIGRMVRCLQDYIKSCVGNGIPHFRRRIKMRESMKTKLIACHDRFLIDDLHVCFI